MEMQMDFDPHLHLEQVRRTAEVTYANNPLDPENLTRWGEALLELSIFQTINESKPMIKDAISKLDEAKGYFDSAYACLKKAVDEDPGNEIYRKSFNMAEKAPEFHIELYKRKISQHAMASGAGAGSSTSSNARGLKSQKISDLKYDIFGWVILAVTIVAWVGFAKANVPHHLNDKW